MNDPKESAPPAYSSKPASYFAGARVGFVDRLPVNIGGRLLEIGCGNGATCAYARQTEKCGWCTGVEICPGPAEEAKNRLDALFVGDVETMELPYPDCFFDALVLSEVLEHLRDPWAVLRKLHRLLKPGANVLAGSPNVAHRSVIQMLLKGRWDYTTSGIMDATHLRWFTPATYASLFEETGYQVISVAPPAPLRFKARWFDRLTFGHFRHLLHTQIAVHAIRGAGPLTSAS